MCKTLIDIAFLSLILQHPEMDNVQLCDAIKEIQLLLILPIFVLCHSPHWDHLVIEESLKLLFQSHPNISGLLFWKSKMMYSNAIKWSQNTIDLRALIFYHVLSSLDLGSRHLQEDKMREIFVHIIKAGFSCIKLLTKMRRTQYLTRA